ncbi:MAG: hypothetical protein LBR10_07820 [Prevotellaceae bacterium]|jgi:hypothetical protein|nr:hypothetical protein [Prevotellaceae bacterium]
MFKFLKDLKDFKDLKVGALPFGVASLAGTSRLKIRFSLRGRFFLNGKYT